MITISSDLQNRFENEMREKAVPEKLWWQYKKMVAVLP